MNIPTQPATTATVPDSVTGSAVLARSWYGHVRAAFGKPHVALMSELHDASSMVSQPLESVASLLGTIPTMRFVTPDRLRRLAEVTTRQAVAVGDVVTAQGDYSDDVYIVLDGMFDVMISHFEHTPDFIRTLRTGDSFGELGVLYDVPRTATIRCSAAGHVLRIPGEGFLDSLETGG